MAQHHGPPHPYWLDGGQVTGHGQGTSHSRRRRGEPEPIANEMKRSRLLMSGGCGYLTGVNTAHCLPTIPVPVNMSRESVITTIQTAVERGDHETLRACLSQCRVERAVLRDPFAIAVQNADHRIVTIFMAGEYRPNLNCMRLTDGVLPLFWAVSRGNLEMAQALLSRPLGPNQIKQIKDHDNRTPLIVATERGHLDMVRVLLDAKFEVNAGVQQCGTPLHIAARSRNVELVRLLLDYGAKPNLLSEPLKETSLMAATSLTPPDVGNVTEKTRAIVSMLLQRKVNVNAADVHQETALYKATRLGDPEVVEMILERGADPEIRRTSKDNSHDGDEAPLFAALERQNIGVFKHLLASRRICLHLQNRGGHYLEYAAKPGMDEFLKLLLAGGANPNWISDKGITSVHQMAATGTDAMMELLISFGARVDFRLADWTTPLVHSAMNSNFPTGRVLVKYNCDLNQKTVIGNDTLEILLAGNFKTCTLRFILLLLEAGVHGQQRIGHFKGSLQESVVGGGSSTQEGRLVEKILDFSLSPPSLKSLCRRRLREFPSIHTRRLQPQPHLSETVMSYLMFMDIVNY